ncbi:ABC transporter ATP-binding protein [Ruminococcus sp. Marseille-P6503]|uniref:ABC transporter ATP-binding protein n=1 Tax=Ruminococcus sp. Marseille-P6503 TaxID=2364796 RepID=UPI000F534ADE|nr:ABC transporter ATP-binding protein [Ruminococcus sp. Marseille-P6503]
MNKTKIFQVMHTLKYIFFIIWNNRRSYFYLWLLKIIFDIFLLFISLNFLPLIIDDLIKDVSIKIIFVKAIIFTAIEGLSYLISNILTLQLEKYNTYFDNKFLEMISKKSMEIDYQDTENKMILDQIEKAKQGIFEYSGGMHGISQHFFNIISNITKTFIAISVIASKAPLILLIISMLLIITSYYNYKINITEASAYEDMSKTARIFTYFLYQMICFENGKDIRLYSAEEMMLEKGSKIINERFSIIEKQSSIFLKYNIKTTISNSLKNSIIYLYLGWLVITEQLTIGLFIKAINAGSTLFSSSQLIIMDLQEIIKKTGYISEFINYMSIPSVNHNGSRKIKNIPNHEIEFKNVSFKYPNTELYVLKNISIKIYARDKISIVGLNGAGKTTFIKLLCGLYKPSSGDILLDGVNINEYDYQEYISLFSVVFQDFKLFAFSIKENIAQNNYDDITEVINKVGLRQKIDALLFGENTTIYKQFDENGIEPSGGEQQKIAIARALHKNSPMVILDEPTAALDPVAENEVYAHFNKLTQNKTTLYISHRLSSCQFCDKIFVFSEKTIKEIGTHEELIKRSDSIYYKMFNAQAQYYKI